MEQHNMLSGVTPKTCPFYKELDAVLSRDSTTAPAVTGDCSRPLKKAILRLVDKVIAFSTAQEGDDQVAGMRLLKPGASSLSGKKKMKNNSRTCQKLDASTLSISDPDRCFTHLMLAFNLTSSDPSTFILDGIPGLEAAHIWISIPFSTFYIMSLLGNFMVLFVVAKERTLHKPMFLLLCMLALTDIGMSTSVVPKALCIFWFGFKEITFNGCLTQNFFLNMFTFMYSAMLVLMAFDRYVAICDPLRYATILTNAQIAKLGLVGLIRAVLLVLPWLLLLRRLPFCANRVIPNTYCQHITMLKISCGDTRINQTYSFVISLAFCGLDQTLIVLSYGLIIRAVLSISSKKANRKALNTCTAHICVMAISCTTGLFSELTLRFGQGIAAHVHVLLGNLYLLVPPMLNPIIYGVKTKELRDKVGKNICRM
ncbi:olfactory receptor 52N4-like [Emydura macquarii macquarii]|uniref:olfactory receptor 52N4-like n=1 Tax=Emydura macquarii macquarii TaxID=1129001 RepID=UPI00352BC213